MQEEKPNIANNIVNLKIKSNYIALVGNPNVGKSTIFNKLTGLSAKTANFSGTTVEKKSGVFKANNKDYLILDLPGIYTLNSESIEEKITKEILLGKNKSYQKPQIVFFFIDASNLERSLALFYEVREIASNIVIVLTMLDVAKTKGIEVSSESLALELGCKIINVEIDKFNHDTFSEFIEENFNNNINKDKACSKCGICPFQDSYNWSENISSRVSKKINSGNSFYIDKLDNILTHPIKGLMIFILVMTFFFTCIFQFASYPMDLIDQFFLFLSHFVSNNINNQLLASLLGDGVVNGVGSLLIFIPQIALLFFLLSILEDTGYLSRVALLLENFFRKVGLPGVAFIPLLSAHACAIPAIMSSRIIEDRRDRLATILVAPLLSCSARLPVYVMIASLLFIDNPIKSGMVFMLAYLLGIFFALLMAWIFKKTILKGDSKQLTIKLPDYRMPNFKNAFYESVSRSWQFIKQAGTIIFIISIFMWALMTFPLSKSQYGELAVKHSYAGQIGTLIEPIIEPLGFDWRIGIGIVSSFVAREVVVSTLGIVSGIENSESESTLYEGLRNMTRSDGTPLFDFATCLSLLIFYVLAMQCLATQVITKKETGEWKWAVFQFGYMTVLAYFSAFLTYNIAKFFI